MYREYRIAVPCSALLLWAYRIGIVCYVTVGIPYWNCLCYCGHTALESSVVLLWAYRFGIVCYVRALELSVMLLWAYRIKMIWSAVAVMRHVCRVSELQKWAFRSAIDCRALSQCSRRSCVAAVQQTVVRCRSAIDCRTLPQCNRLSQHWPCRRRCRNTGMPQCNRLAYVAGMQ